MKYICTSTLSLYKTLTILTYFNIPSLVSDQISPGRAAVGGSDDGRHVIQQHPGHVRVELEGLVGDLLVVEGFVSLLVELPKVVNPDLKSEFRP